MTQRQITHPDGVILPCAGGHAGHHIQDMRGDAAGGGHFIECECRKTARYAALDGALVEWRRLNKHRKPRKPRSAPPLTTTKPKRAKDAGSTVLQFSLPLAGEKRGKR